MKKDLLGIDDLSKDDIYRLLETSEAMREIGERPIKKVPTLRGKTVVNLFYEPSTRTRTSFEIAEKRLSADTLNIAVASSSGIAALKSSGWLESGGGECRWRDGWPPSSKRSPRGRRKLKYQPERSTSPSTATT